MEKKDLQTFDVIHTYNPFVWYKPWRYLSAIIRAFQKLRFGRYAWSSHTAIIIVDDLGEVWVYEADPKVKKTKWDNWCYDKKIAITRYPDNLLKKTKTNKNKLLNFCDSLLGTKYDFMGLIVWQPIYILTNKWFGKKDNGKYYCSEYVASALDIFLNNYPNDDEINPSKLYCDMINYEIYKGDAKNIK